MQPAIPPRDGPATPSNGLVGRDDLLAQLRTAVDRAFDGTGQVVVLSGEAGIGKTAAAAEAASYARDRGARVLWAACWQGEGVPGYWPWVQVARELLEPGTSGVLGRLLETGEPDGSGRHDTSPGAGRFELFDELTSALLAEAEVRPLVLVLDDLQWADVSSALLLGFLARRLRASRLLVIGTLRDDELERGGRLPAALAEIGSAGTVVPLAPLSDAEVGELVAATIGRDADPGLVEEIRARAGGNPFFVRELSRLLLARGADAGLPIGVTEAVERRLERLGPDVGNALRAAALIGTEVPASLLARVVRLPDSAATDLLDEAVRAQVLVAPSEPLAPYRFAHDLFREAIDQRLDAASRAAIHLEIALVLEAVREAGGTVPAARLARHYLLAAGAGSQEPVVPRGAVRWSRRAAAEASRRLAHDEAALHWSNALTILDLARASGPETRAGILLELGAAHRRAGDVAAARDDYLRAADLARRSQSATALANAALGLHAIGTRSMQPADELVAILEESLSALATIPEHADAGRLRALVLASLARVLAWFGHDLPRSRSLAEEAVLTARNSAKGATTATCLLALHNVIWGPGTAVERLQLADEVIELAGGAGDGELVVEARLLRVADLLELGDPAYRTAMAEFLAAAEGLRQPRLRYLALSRRATLAIMSGELAEAERLIAEAAALGAEIGEPDRIGVELEQRWELRSIQGRRADLEHDLDLSMLPARDSLQARGMHALALVELGELEEAAAVIGPPDDLRPDELPRDYAWTVQLAYAAELLAVLGEIPARLRVYEALAPLEGGAAVIGAAVAFKGAVGHHLGLLAAAVGRRDRAIAHLERAVEVQEALGARAWALRSAYELGRLLGELPETAKRSRSMLAEVAATAERMGLGRLAGLARAAEPTEPTEPTEPPLEARPVEGRPVEARPADARRPGRAAGTFRRDGSLWTLGLHGDSVRMRDAKGLADIATLLARPGREVSAADLVAASGAAEAATADLSLGADQVLDERARRQVRERLAYLEAEIDQAESWGDPERASRARAERDALVDELAAATGLGGRSRRLGDQSERARKAVTARIRDAIDRIERAHPGLGAHLRYSVTTGGRCAYSPAAPVDWEL